MAMLHKASRAAVVTALALTLALSAIALLHVGVEGASPLAASGDHPAASSRYIVQLTDAPVATYSGGIAGLSATTPDRGSGKRLELSATASQAYATYLQAQQAKVEAALKIVAPDAVVERRYTVVFNGLAVRMDEVAAQRVRALSEVKAVIPDHEYTLLLDHSVPLIGAPQLWTQLGGAEQAGRGIKVAVVDSGIYISNTFFNPAGFAYPPGFPKGETRFTTPKVIAARAYFRPDDPPRPGQETPLPGTAFPFSHGTHVAGIIGGVPGTTITLPGSEGATFGITHTLSGVAPGVWLMNYKAFYDAQSGARGAYSAELIAALEDAVRDGADVISNSWGADTIGPSWADPIVQAAEAAIDAGVVVVFAAGNSGPQRVSLGSPAISPRVISVGASTTPITVSTSAGAINVTAPQPVMTDVVGLQWKQLPQLGPVITQTIGPLPYIWAGAVPPDHNPDGCNPDGSSVFAPGSLTGRILLVRRGTCTALEKVRGAQAAGALAVVIYETTDWSWDSGCFDCGDVVIPAVAVLDQEGNALVNWYRMHPDQSKLEISVTPRQIAIPPDAIARFSSRGPTPDLRLKPDVVAPGAYIISSGYGPDPIPVGGFGVASGTSMAAPHVAGGAALLGQLHPDWTPEGIKSALMTTAKVEGLSRESSGAISSVLDYGAGRIDLARAGDPGLVLDTPSLSLALRQGTSQGEVISATSAAALEETYTLTVSETQRSGAGVVVRPSLGRVRVGAGASDRLTVTIAVAPDAPPGDYMGLLWLRSPQHTAHIPYWVRVLPVAPAGVLLLDNDGSSTSEGQMPDYTRYYTETLDRLGVSYTYFDADATDLSAAFSLADLLQYKTILWFTGDNGRHKSPGRALADHALLAEYLNSGGRLLATGQNFAMVSTEGGDPGEGIFDQGYLGSEYVQDSLYRLERAGRPPQPSVMAADPSGFLGPMRLDLSVPPTRTLGAGAGNQLSIDELAPSQQFDVFALGYARPQPLLTAIGGRPVAAGHVGLSVSAEPSLEGPTPAFRFRTVQLAFGLEGVNDNTGYTTRQRMLDSLLSWLNDDVRVQLTVPSTVTVGTPTTLTAAATSSMPNASFTHYRWDFGDGTPIRETLGPSVLHVYRQPGTYVLRLEATDSYGHVALASKEVVIVRPTADDRRQLYLPYVLRTAGPP